MPDISSPPDRLGGHAPQSAGVELGRNWQCAVDSNGKLHCLKGSISAKRRKFEDKCSWRLFGVLQYNWIIVPLLQIVIFKSQ